MHAKQSLPSVSTDNFENVSDVNMSEQSELETSANSVRETLETSANSVSVSDSSYLEDDDDLYFASEEQVQSDHDYFNPETLEEEVTEIENGAKNKRKRKKETTLEDVAIDYFGKRARETTDPDGMMNFFKSLLPDIKDFPKEKKRLLKFKILNIVNELADE